MNQDPQTPLPSQTPPEPQSQPTASQPTTPPPVVQVIRPIEPEKPHITPEQLRRHERSRRLYPNLNLSEGEYVIASVRRHPIGLVIPLGLGTFLIALTIIVLMSRNEIAESLAAVGPFASADFITLPLYAFIVLVALGMFVSYYVYTRNRFFLTSESVIQEIQTSLFSHQEQTVSLANIEDASYTKTNIIQQIFDYGDIRLSTEGDETTYRFSFVAHPKGHISTLNNAVEAFKNGRPVSDD